MLHLVVRQMEHAPAMRRENDDVTATAACDPNPAHPVELIGDYTQCDRTSSVDITNLRPIHGLHDQSEATEGGP